MVSLLHMQAEVAEFDQMAGSPATCLLPASHRAAHVAAPAQFPASVAGVLLHLAPKHVRSPATC